MSRRSGRRDRRPQRKLADYRARLAASMATAAAAHEVKALGPIGDMPGCCAYAIGKVLVLQPILSEDAPDEMRAKVLCRVIANATGTCPVCEATVGVPRGLDRPVPNASMEHERACPVGGFGPTDGRWLDQRGIRLLSAAAAAS